MRIGKQTNPDKFQCMKCQHKWAQLPKYSRIGYTSAADPCPECGSLYCTWLNWKKEK